MNAGQLREVGLRNFINLARWNGQNMSQQFFQLVYQSNNSITGNLTGATD